MRRVSPCATGAILLLAAGLCGGFAHAAERVTLSNGFEVVCDHQQISGTRARLYLTPGTDNFVEVDAAEIVSAQEFDPPRPNDVVPDADAPRPPHETLSRADLRQVVARAGVEHNLNMDLLASVIQQESGGHVRAVSHAGAQGLMQLMPGTASELGVKDCFDAKQNVTGGAAYLDSLLSLYHDNLALALAAYNAGPAAVERWHGIPPYPETRAYVARVIHDFNRRYAARMQMAKAQQR